MPTRGPEEDEPDTGTTPSELVTIEDEPIIGGDFDYEDRAEDSDSDD